MEITTLPTYLIVPVYEYEMDVTEMKIRLNMFSIVAYSLVFVLGTIGNGLVIFITGFRMSKTVNSVWILNLAIADFTCSFFLPLKIVYLSLGLHWPFGLVLCKLENTLCFLNLYASVYFLVVISMDRCLSVWWPVQAQNYRTLWRASFVALGVWILALLLCSPNLYFRNSSYDNETDTTFCYSDYGSNYEEGISILYAVIISRFILAFIIPFSVIAFCYGAMVWKFRRDRMTRSNKPFKVITAVIVAFFVCWLPFHIFVFLEAESQVENQVNVVIFVGVHVTFCLAYFNSCVNPILYVFMGRRFKDRLRRSFLSTFENAFVEDSSHATKCSTVRSTSERETFFLP
ncbi:chemerin-like receptor 1 [Tiliqua scincoides]|uniref:chemerin-like receptor 1 n=1 Tax=Tiliqua scincoides TaxID=71010 RepID=UPI0034618032